MAELYFKQGHPGRALAIYEKLAKANPSDSGIATRLAELRTLLGKGEEHSMSFREHMQQIIQSTPGAVACVVMGFDGIAIDTVDVGVPGIDVSNLLIEYAAAAKQLRRSDQMASAGALSELTVVGEKVTAVLRPLTPDYFLAIVLQPNAIVGKARYLLRVTGPKIAQELL